MRLLVDAAVAGKHSLWRMSRHLPSPSFARAARVVSFTFAPRVRQMIDPTFVEWARPSLAS
jgi:hypothetical protein